MGPSGAFPSARGFVSRPSFVLDGISLRKNGRQKFAFKPIFMEVFL